MTAAARGVRSWIVRASALALALALLACGSGRAGKRAVAGYAVGTSQPQSSRAVRALVQVGPVPDYAPMRAIVSHATVAEMIPDLPPLLTAVLGDRHVVSHYTAPEPEPEPGDVDRVDDSLVWLRDYQPIFVRGRDGILSEVRYLSDNPNRSAFRLETLGLAAPRAARLPILHENGNLVRAGSWVFVTETMLDDNSSSYDQPHMLEMGYRGRGREELLRLLARTLGVTTSDIIVMPAMPYEGTGHVDLFLLPLDDTTVMIPMIDEAGLSIVRGERAHGVGEVVRQFLDEQADYVTALGLNVLRMPMVPPALGTWEEDESEAERTDFELLVFTPANSLLANVGGRRVVFVPSFPSVAEDPRLASLFARYSSIWDELFRSRGWEPYRVDGSELVGHLGLLRCVTASIPE